MRNKKIKIMALVISLCAHVVVLFSSMAVVLPNIIDAELEKRKKFEVKVTSESKFIPAMSDQQSGDAEHLRFESREFAGRINSFLDREKQHSKKKNLEFTNGPEKQLLKSEKSKEFFDVKKSFKPDRTLKPKRVREIKEDKKGVIKVAYDQIIDRIDQEIKLAELEDAFVNKMPGFTPVFSYDDAAISTYADVGSNLGKGNVGGLVKRQKMVGDFTGELFWSLEVYLDPLDLKKYFRIRVRVNDEGSNFKTIPKELAILVDCSKSIDNERLVEFRDGIGRGLRTLNEEDVFNLTVFKDRVFTFAKKPVSPTEINIQTALEFLSQFQ
ncbi:hypothetical protein ACFL49_01780, partial [Candidatus Omnitrophota bacterium]